MGSVIVFIFVRSDIHGLLSISSQNSLDGKTFTSNKDMLKTTWIYKLFCKQRSEEPGIMRVPKKWQYVLDHNGQYIIK